MSKKLLFPPWKSVNNMVEKSGLYAGTVSNMVEKSGLYAGAANEPVKITRRVQNKGQRIILAGALPPAALPVTKK